MKKNLKLAAVYFSIFFLIAIVLFLNDSSKEEEKNVNVYGWYGIIPREIFNDFEAKTGIKVIYDVYDNNESLEAKLLATNSGYDIVFPSFIPYAARQASMGAYSKINPNLLPNIKNIDGIITNRFKKAGGNTEYLIPIFWGTIGIAYECNTINHIFPNEKIKSYDILLKKEKIKKLKNYGVSFPEEYIDIFPQVGSYLKIQPDKNIENLKIYAKYLKKIRKYITKFSSTTLINDLLSGEVCIAIGSSDSAWKAMNSGKNVNKKIDYILPENCTILWIDCIGIPKKAPHKKNAHKFLNYLMSHEIAAKITNYSGILVNIPQAQKYFDKKIQNNDQIFPQDSELLETFMIGAQSISKQDLQFDREATRTWSQIKLNSFEKQKIEKE